VSTATATRGAARTTASASAKPFDGKDVRLVAICFLVALALRLAFVIIIERPSFGFNDASFYHFYGDSLAEGRGYVRVDGSPTAQWPPGFSFLLSVVYRLFGTDPLNGEILNAVLGALTVALLYVVARRAFGRAEAAVAAAWLAVLPGPILWADVLFSETFYTFMLMVVFALLAVLPIRWWAVFLLGLVVGAAALVRGEGLFLALPALAFWWGVAEGGDQGGGRGRWTWPANLRTLTARSAVLGAAMVLAITPWTIRNAIRLDTFAPVSSNVGATLWAGHNPSAYGGPTYYQDYERFGDDIVKREVESAKYLRGEALDYMVNHPVRELQLIPLKLIYLNRGDAEVLELVNSAAPGDREPLKRTDEIRLEVAANVGYYGLLTLTVISVALLRRDLWRRPITRAALAAIITSLVLYGFLYFGSYRYRFPLEPLMILVATPLLTRVWRARPALSHAD
jgi:hypothetical protein